MQRLVKLTFRPEACAEFEEIFRTTQDRIAAFPGCRGVQCWRDRGDERVYFTYSQWEGPEALEAYRQSELFQATWARTKALFAERAQAWSLDDILP